MAACAAPLHADELAQLPIKPASERRLIGRNTDAIDIPAKTNGTARYGIDATIDGMVYARPKIPPTRNGATRALDRRFRRQEGQGLYQQPRARRPLRYGSGLGDGVRELLSGRDQRGRPCQGRLVGRRRREDLRAGHPRSWRETDRRSERRQPRWWTIEGLDGGFPSCDSTLEQTYTTSSVLHAQLEPVNALAFEKDGILEIHTGNQWQTSDPARARQGAPHAAGANRDAHLFNRRRLRPQAQRRLCRACGARRQGARQACQDGADACRRHALRLVSLALDPNAANGVQRRRQGHGNGSSSVGGLAHAVSWRRKSSRKGCTACPTTLSRSQAPTIGTMWARNACGRCRTTSPTAPSGPDGCARLDPAGPIGHSRASSTRPRMRGGVDPVAFRVAHARRQRAQCRHGTEFRRRREAPGGGRAARGAESGLGRRMPKDTGSASPPHLARNATCRPGSPASRASGRSRQRCGDRREADDRRRCRHGRASGWRAGAGRRRRALGLEHGAA